MSTDTVSQERLVAFLVDPRSYPAGSRRIRLLQTHSCWVVLTPHYAFKVKKPVDFGFLDFSTLEKRRQFCEREVMLNRRLSPDVYLGVVPIRLTKGRLSFDPVGEIVEYAVKMRRLPERFFMLTRMERGEVTTCHVDAIVAKLQAFYEAQEPARTIAAWGRVSRLRISTDENFQQTQDYIGKTITRAAFEAIRRYTDAFYRHHRSLFAARIREGRILDCHGDLHLEHIHLGPTRLAIYDCIEFNDRFRYIDVASDVAFLAMDFDFHGRPDLARHFTTHMARALKDPDMLQILHFYQCYRAYVRGKVESLQQSADGVPEAERRKSQVRAERYFQLALRYAVCGAKPTVLIAMGRVASGKSTLAQALGRELGCKVFSSDRLRKELAGAPLYVRGSDSERRRLYTKKMSDKTYAALARQALEEVRAHRSVVLDATFSSRRRREAIGKRLARAGAGYCFIETRAAAVTIKKRLAERAHSTGEISDARLEDLPSLDPTYEPPGELESQHFLSVRTGRSTEAALGEILKALALRNARQ